MCLIYLNDYTLAEFDTSVRYNRPGSLLTWNQKVFTPVGHRRENHHYSLNNSESWKYYAVNDVKFDPVGYVVFLEKFAISIVMTE